MSVARPTIVDVADAAGVSVGTASDALNNKGRMTDATRDRVIAAAQAMGYRARAAARGLVARRMMALGVRVGGTSGIPDVGFFFVSLLNAAAEAAAERGYGLMVTTAGFDESMLVDGLIVVDPLSADELDAPVSAGLPVVTIGRSLDRDVDVPSVDADLQRSLSPLLDHLGAQARPGRALMLSPLSRPSYIQDMEATFAAWCQRHGYEHHIAHCADDVDAVTEAISAQIAAHGAPVLLVGALDRHAAWGMRALKRAGFAVPEDVVVAAATDGESLRLVDPPITALDLDGAAHGRAAVAVLFDQLDDPATRPANALIQARFTIRGSSTRDHQDAPAPSRA